MLRDQPWSIDGDWLWWGVGVDVVGDGGIFWDLVLVWVWGCVVGEGGLIILLLLWANCVGRCKL